jgi:hypothetical protein
VGLALLLALQVLTGEPQLVIFSALLGFTLCAFLPSRHRDALALAGALILAAVLAAFQLLPAWQLFKESSRSLASGFLNEWSLHPSRLLEAMFPFPFGGYLEVPQFWAWVTVKGPGSIPWAMSVYLGSSTVVLAVLGIGRDRRSYLGVFLLLLGLGIALGIYLPAFSLIHTLPPFRFFRYPQKYFLLSALGAAILASAGLENMLARRTSRPIAAAFAIFSLLAIGFATISGEAGWALQLGRAIFDRAGITGDPHLPVQTLSASFRAGGPFALAIAMLALLSSRRVPGASPLPAIRAYACILVVGLDLWLAMQRVVWFGPIELFRTVPSVVAKVREALPPEGGRFFREDAPLDSEAPHSRNREQLVQRRWWELETLKSNLGSLYGLEEASGRLPFSIRRYGDFMRALAASPAKRDSLLNSCITLTASTAPVPAGMRVALTAPELRLSLLTVDACLPRLRSVQSIEQASSPAQAMSRLAQPGFDIANSALVEGEPSATFESATIDSVRSTLDSLEARVHANASGAFLVYSNVFYPGWTARLDGVETPVRAVDGLLLGVRVPSGTHTLNFQFRETTLPFGAILSTLGLLGALGALAFARFRRSP